MLALHFLFEFVVCINLKPAIMTIVQALGTFIPWLPGTNRRPCSESSPARFILTCFHQFSSNLWWDIFYEIKPEAREEEPRSQSWGWSSCPWCPDLGSTKQIYLQTPVFLCLAKLLKNHCFLPCETWIYFKNKKFKVKYDCSIFKPLQKLPCNKLSFIYFSRAIH